MENEPEILERRDTEQRLVTGFPEDDGLCPSPWGSEIRHSETSRSICVPGDTLGRRLPAHGEGPDALIEIARRIAYSPRFQTLVLAVIIVAAVVVGIETSATLTSRYAGVFHAIDMGIQAFFVAEIAIRLLAYWPRPLRFFRDGWNVFDFAVVVTSLLPQAGPFAIVARLARLMRVTRLVSVFPELRLIIGTMLRSIPSMGHVIMLLALLLYVYAILGFYLFSEEDPERWSTLGTALLTLFQMLTLEGWVEIQDGVLDSYPFAWMYFGSFVFVAVFVVVNLFIAVVINNLESVKHEEQVAADRTSRHGDLLASIGQLRQRLDELERELRRSHER